MSHEIVRQSNDNFEMLETIADNRQTLDDIKMLTSTKVNDQLKVFLIAQARNELRRVISLTTFLDKLEAAFMSKVDEAMMDDSLTIRQYSNIINVITGLLDRSNTIISSVLKDDSLTTILNTTIYSTDTGVQTTSIVSQLKDSQSRERVRSVLQNILFKTENYSPSITVEGGDTSE